MLDGNISKENKRIIMSVLFQFIFCLFFIYAKYENKEEYVLATIIFIIPFILDNLVGVCTSETQKGIIAYLIVSILFIGLILPCTFYKIGYIPDVEYGIFKSYISEGKINFFITVFSIVSKIIGSKF